MTRRPIDVNCPPIPESRRALHSCGLHFLLLSLLLLSAGCGRPSAGSGSAPAPASASDEEAFIQISNTGRNYYDRGETDRAITSFQEAVRLQPSNTDALLNLGNAFLLGNKPAEAIQQASKVLEFDAGSPAALYLMGCAELRLGRAEPAVKALQSAKNIDRTVNEVSFQLGRAQQMLNQHEAAIAEFEEVIRFGPGHPAAHYALSQSLLRAGRSEDADKALAEHQKIHAGKPPQITDPALFERCKYTQARVPFRQNPPAAEGIRVQFVDATVRALGPAAPGLRAPVAVIDLGNARNSLLLRETEQSFRVLANSNGTYVAQGNPMPTKPGARYHKALVADLNNDRAEDVIILGQGGSHAFRFTTNGTVNDATAFANLRSLSATNGVLADYLFTGNIGLIALGHGSDNVRFFRNLGSMYFSTNSTNIGIPLDLNGSRQVVADDWNGDDLIDLIIQRDNLPPLLLTKQSGGPLISTNSPADWPAASALTTGDINNDSRNDLVTLSGDSLILIQGGLDERITLPLGANHGITGLHLVDYDNDGWLDLLATGEKPRAWRNRWKAGFLETTAALGLQSVGAVSDVKPFDFDNDGDIDLLWTRPDQTLAFSSNEGGNVNRLLKIRLVGNRSNASGIGVKIEISSGSTRFSRRVLSFPVEIGVGNLEQIESLNARWFTLNLNTVDVKVDPTQPVRLDELVIADTSCPYLYVWDGKGFRFVTDLLGAAPIGLPVAAGRYIEADADEFVWVGDDRTVQPREGRYLLSITEELREVLYLDEARLFAVDHAPGTEVHPTDKLLPSGPFPPSELITLEHQRPLLRAARLDGSDATAALRFVDGDKVSPLKLREPQLRGLAEPHGVVLDFGPLPTERPLVLALTGWLRFGGGMANMAASIYPDLPFPFPALEVETEVSGWQKLDLEPGAPVGKTKTILVDLQGRLPAGSRRLRLTTAFEIHWDRIALWERRQAQDTRMNSALPSKTDLRWRGFGEIAALPWHEPQTPIYDRVQANPPWRISPGGWATRYGKVDELVAARDNRLVLVNSGDELLLEFDVRALPAKPAGMLRNFFLYSVGWEKDGDFHVAKRDAFEPLPWHGMDDQKHGVQPRPKFPDDDWIQKYNTRWCDSRVLTRR